MGIFYNIRVGNLSDDVSKILNTLRLREIYSGVFLKLDKKLASTLKKIDPYVTYGYLFELDSLPKIPFLPWSTEKGSVSLKIKDNQ